MILLIEDDVISQKVLKLILEYLGKCNVEQAYDLQSALTHREKIYDIIFTDLHLPDGSAITFIEQYHKKHPVIPIVVMSSYIDDEEKIFKAGAIEIVRKPASIELIKRLLQAFLPSSTRNR